MSNEAITEKPSLLLTEDDELFARVLCKALEKRDYQVTVAHSVEEAISVTQDNSPEFAVVDLNMPGQSGLVLVKYLMELDSHTRVVVLTGYASITTAVEAIKLGAIHYLAKPADADEVINAFYKDKGDENIDINFKPQSVNRLEWEHIQKVLKDNDGNISATARALGMHRRTLQRKLQKKPMAE